MGGLFKRIDTVFLPVRNLDAAIDWYTKTLGLTLRWKSGNYAAMNAGETAFTLFQPEGEFQPFAGHMPFNFYVTDPEEAHKRLAAAGAQVQLINRETGFAWFDWSDPDGNQLGICWFPEK